jgi:hypothetical protein
MPASDNSNFRKKFGYTEIEAVFWCRDAKCSPKYLNSQKVFFLLVVGGIGANPNSNGYFSLPTTIKNADNCCRHLSSSDHFAMMAARSADNCCRR